MKKCDVCKKECKHLVDYFSLLCDECKVKHTDVVLLQRLRDSLTTVESLKQHIAGLESELRSLRR